MVFPFLFDCSGSHLSHRLSLDKVLCSLFFFVCKHDVRYDMNDCSFPLTVVLSSSFLFVSPRFHLHFLSGRAFLTRRHFPFRSNVSFFFSHRQRNRFLLLPFFFLPSSEMPLPFAPFCAKCRLRQRETNEIASSSNRGRRQVRLSSGMLCVKKLMVGMSRVQYKKDVNTRVEQEKTTHHTCAVSAFFHLLSV